MATIYLSKAQLDTLTEKVKKTGWRRWGLVISADPFNWR